MVLTLFYTLKDIDKFFTSSILLAARTAHNKDVLYRHWVAMQGGVYVPITELTPPNPFLSNNPNRDITSTSGLKLTLINPAFMTRLVYESFPTNEIRSHLISLDPVNDNNLPDEWEKFALRKIMEGKDEIYITETFDNKEYLKMVKAFIADKSCLKCHNDAYCKPGKPAGAISINYETTAVKKRFFLHKKALIVRHIIIWLIGFVFIFIGLYTIQRYVKRLQKMQSKLHANNMAKDTFFSIIGHDLRAPLNGLIGYSDLLISKRSLYDEEKQQKFLKSINISAHLMNNLLDNLLTWSREQSGLIDYNPAPLELKIFCDELILLFNEIALQKEVHIINNIIDECNIRAGRNMLETIFRNLLNNAIKYTGPGGQVSISSYVYGKYCIIEISDTGIGMSNEQLSNLFLFTALQSTSGTSNEKGTGLGLILCKDFIERHGGKITIESEMGHGTKVKLSIPINSKKIH